MVLNRKIAPEFNGIENVSFIKPEHIVLDNGCNVYCFNSGEQELVRIEWIFSNLRFDTTRPLLNMAVNTMLMEGTGKMSSSQIADKIDFHGAFLQTEYGFDQSNVTLFSLNKHLADTLPVVKDILTNSIFPQQELETFVRNQQQKLQVNLQKNDIVARRTFNKALFGDTIYGYNTEAEDYQSLQREDILEHFKQMYQPSNCSVIIAGKVEKDALSMLTGLFGGNWANTTEKPDTKQPEPEAAVEHFYFKEKPEALQSAIRMGLPLFDRTHPDFPAMQVLNTVLGGYFGSRLMANIREDKGYTYGIGSGLNSLKKGGAFFIATEVGADVCRDAVNEIEKEINKLKTELIPVEELALVRNFMLGSLLGSMENVLSHADKFKNLLFCGLDYNYYDRYIETVKTIQPGQLLQLANKYWDLDKFYKVIAGKY